LTVSNVTKVALKNYIIFIYLICQAALFHGTYQRIETLTVHNMRSHSTHSSQSHTKKNYFRSRILFLSKYYVLKLALEKLKWPLAVLQDEWNPTYNRQWIPLFSLSQHNRCVLKNFISPTSQLLLPKKCQFASN